MELTYKDVPIEIEFDIEESQKHIEEDFNILCEADIETLIKEHFIPWLLNDQFKDRDPQKVFEGLRVFEIFYNYGKIIAKYSPTGEENYFSQFEFDFESSNEYTEDILEASAMKVYILNGKIVKVEGYDI
ncbi:MAG: hypothetical protein J6E46_07010 [Faecalicoccus sp.]|nr:hypothetical protein [Faecalicoccus sp.]